MSLCYPIVNLPSVAPKFGHAFRHGPHSPPHHGVLHAAHHSQVHIAAVHHVPAVAPSTPTIAYHCARLPGALPAGPGLAPGAVAGQQALGAAAATPGAISAGSTSAGSMAAPAIAGAGVGTAGGIGAITKAALLAAGLGLAGTAGFALAPTAYVDQSSPAPYVDQTSIVPTVASQQYSPVPLPTPQQFVAAPSLPSSAGPVSSSSPTSSPATASPAPGSAPGGAAAPAAAPILTAPTSPSAPAAPVLDLIPPTPATAPVTAIPTTLPVSVPGVITPTASAPVDRTNPVSYSTPQAPPPSMTKGPVADNAVPMPEPASLATMIVGVVAAFMSRKLRAREGRA